MVQVREHMPRLVEAVQQAGQIVTWVCDPMHGNTESVAGYKTRRYERIRQEARPFPWPPVAICSSSKRSRLVMLQVRSYWMQHFC